MSNDNNSSSGNNNSSNGGNQSGGSSNSQTTTIENTKPEGNSPFQNPAQISTRMEVPVKRTGNNSNDSSDKSE